MTTVGIEESVNDLDKWIEKLNDCKPLTEAEVKQLCDMVSLAFIIPGSSLFLNDMPLGHIKTL